MRYQIHVDTFEDINQEDLKDVLNKVAVRIVDGYYAENGLIVNGKQYSWGLEQCVPMTHIKVLQS